MSSTVIRYLRTGLLGILLLLVFLAYLQPSFLLEMGSRLQLC